MAEKPSSSKRKRNGSEKQHAVAPQVPFDGKPYISIHSHPGLRPSFVVFEDTLLPDWKVFNLNPAIKRSIHVQNFLTPTEIQTRALPLALEGKDVIGVAETVRTSNDPSILQLKPLLGLRKNSCLRPSHRSTHSI